MHAFRRFILFALLIPAACALPQVKAREIEPDEGLYAALPPNPTLLGQVALRDSRVEKIGMDHFAPLTPEVFAIALRQAFRQAGYLAPDRKTASYQVDAHVTGLNESGLFTNICVTTVDYTVDRRSPPVRLLTQTVTMPATLGVFDVMDGNQRERQCATRALRENIAHFVNLLARMPT